MPGRGPTTFQKRQKEQARKEKREEKLARRHAKKAAGVNSAADDDTLLDDIGAEDDAGEAENLESLPGGSPSGGAASKD